MIVLTVFSNAKTLNVRLVVSFLAERSAAALKRAPRNIETAAVD
jgi:hypothetical protein